MWAVYMCGQTTELSRAAKRLRLDKLLDRALCMALHKALCGLFPILSVECVSLERRNVDSGQAANIDNPGGWSNTRSTESADTAMTARVVLCSHSAELIQNQILFASQDLEVRIIGAMPKCSLPTAEGAIALNDGSKIRPKSECDAAAMT